MDIEKIGRGRERWKRNESEMGRELEGHGIDMESWKGNEGKRRGLETEINGKDEDWTRSKGKEGRSVRGLWER